MKTTLVVVFSLAVGIFIGSLLHPFPANAQNPKSKKVYISEVAPRTVRAVGEPSLDANQIAVDAESIVGFSCLQAADGIHCFVASR